jgi:hypothetical protein
MNRISVFLLSAILATCSFSPGIWARDNASDEIHTSLGTGRCVQNKTVTGQPTSKADHNARFETEIRKGASVARRATQLRATNKGFAKAYADILKRGGKPLFEEAGVSVIARDAKGSQFKKVSSTSAQQLSDGDYEMTFFPFDTGNDAVWEGTIYVKGPANEGTWAVSMSTTHEDISELEVYYENYYTPEGSRLEAATPAREGGRFTKAGFVAAGLKGAPNTRVYTRFQSWLNCVNTSCYTAMRACLWTGPFYFICFNSWCLGSMISCLPPIL